MRRWLYRRIERVLQRACDYAVLSQSEENSSGRGQ